MYSKHRNKARIKTIIDNEDKRMTIYKYYLRKVTEKNNSTNKTISTFIDIFLASLFFNHFFFLSQKLREKAVVKLNVL